MEMWAVILTFLSLLFRWVMPREFGVEKIGIKRRDLIRTDGIMDEIFGF